MGNKHDKFDNQGREKVRCEICGCYFHRLDVHLSTQHDTNVAEYNRDHPGCPTISGSAKKRASKGQLKGGTFDPIANVPVAAASTPPIEDIEITEGSFKVGVAQLAQRTGLEPHDLPYVPQHDAGFIFGKTEMENWEDIAIGIEDKEPIYIAGPTGCGKTAGVMELGAALNQPVRRIQLNRDFKVGEFVGRGTLETDEQGNTVTGWKDGVLTEAMRNGWWLLLDEMDQAHPDVLMKLQAILEGAPLVLTENFGEVVNPHEDFRIIATANTMGRGDETGLYAGAKVMNEATLDRFGVVLRADCPERGTEEIIVKGRSGIDHNTARKMVTVAHKVREALEKEECCCTFSTRRLIAWASKTVRYNGDARRAAKTAILNKLETEDAQFVNELIQRYFGGEI